MTPAIAKEYQKRRKATLSTLHAKRALSEARTTVRFHELEASDRVRLRVVADECTTFDELCGDTFDPRANPDISPKRLEREKDEFLEQVNREGVIGLIGEYFDGEEWQQADSCFGFVGDGWKESGYDIDIMASAIEAAEKVHPCPTCGRPSKAVSHA